MESHPLWVRGLKRLSLASAESAQVASFMGAWVETFGYYEFTSLCSRILYGCVG